MLKALCESYYVFLDEEKTSKFVRVAYMCALEKSSHVAV